MPEIIAYDLQQGFILLSDLGDALYLKLFATHNVDRLYSQALSVLHRWQRCQPDLPSHQPLKAFDETTLRFEFELFGDWFLKRHLGSAVTPSLKEGLEKNFSLLIVSALEQPQVLEIALDGVANTELQLFQTFSKFPRVRRDLSFWLDKNIEAAAVLEQAKLAGGGGAWLDDLYLFDVYEDKKRAALQRSFALALIWQHPERTLTDKETDQSFEQVIASLQKHFAIKLREAE